MELTEREQRLIAAAKKARPGTYTKAALVLLVLNGIGGLLQVIVGVLVVAEDQNMGWTRLILGALMIAFAILLCRHIRTTETAYSIMRKLGSDRDGCGSP